MIGNWKILAAVPLAIAIGACSSRSSNTDTAAGTLSTDTALTPAPSIPTPGMDTGMVLDTTKKKADSTHADSLKDSTHKAKSSTYKHKSTKKGSTTKKP